MEKSELVNKFFDKILEYADGVGEIAKNEAPKYIEELLAFGVVESEMYLWFYLISAILTLFVFLFSFFKFITDDHEWIALFIFSLIPLITFFGCAIDEYLTLKKIETAPRVYIVDEIKSKY